MEWKAPPGRQTFPPHRDSQTGTKLQFYLYYCYKRVLSRCCEHKVKYSWDTPGHVCQINLSRGRSNVYKKTNIACRRRTVISGTSQHYTGSKSAAAQRDERNMITILCFGVCVFLAIDQITLSKCKQGGNEKRENTLCAAVIFMCASRNLID